MTKLTQADMEVVIERLVNRVNAQDERIARLERTLCIPPKVGPDKFKNKDIIPVVDRGDLE